MNNQTKTLAVLIVEDVESDAQLLLRQLKKAGYELVYEQVETASQMRAALAKRTWDIIISDYSLPQFDGHSALMLLKETGLDIPFIIVSGTVGEKTAVAMMKAGAQDYLMKNDLARLVPAVERELGQAGMRRDRRKAREELLLQSSALNAAANAIVITDRDGTIEWVNPAFTMLTGYTFEEAVGENPRDLVKSGRHDRSFYQNFWDTILAGEVWRGEFINRRKDGSLYTEEQTITPLVNADGTIDHFIAIKQDVSERKQVEKALAASEAEMRALFASMQDVVLVIDRQGFYRKIAPTNPGLLVEPASDLLGKNLRDIFPVEQAEDFIGAIQQVLDTEQITKIEYGLLIKDRTVYFETSISPMDKDSTLWVAHDITQRKLAEERLRESEEKFHTLFNNSEIGMFRTRLDGSEILEFNEKYLGILNYTSEDLKDVPSVNLWVNKRERDRLVQLLNAEGRVMDFECSLSSRHGEIKRCLMSVRLYRDTGILEGSIQDITERKQAEEALAASEAKLRALVEQVPATVYTDSAETRIPLYVSPQIEKLTGYTPAEWVEDYDLWKKVIHPADVDAIVEANDRTSLTHDPLSIEYRILTRDGHILWIRDESVMIQNQDGAPLFWQGVMYDITERKQAEETLKISEEKYRELFNRMIDGFALHEIICDENGKPVDYRFLEVNQAFERLTGLQSANLIGRTALEVMPRTEPYWIEIYGNVALTGRSTFFENYYGELNRYFEVSAYCPSPGQFATIVVDITERKNAEKNIHQRVTELKMLYQSGLMLGQLLNPKEVGKKILELLEEKLNWHNTRIRLYHPQDDSLELLDFNQPGLTNDTERLAVVEHFQSLITRPSQGMSGWVIQHGQPVRSGDVTHDPRYIEAYPGIHSGLYVPMKLGERNVGVISIEDEKPDAFSETDERLIVTLANQAASAFENARLFGEIRQRVMELETLNRISLVLRAVSNQYEMLSIVLDEALAIMKTSHGFILLYNKTTDTLEKTIMRGWTTQVDESPQNIHEGIVGRVFTSGEIHISRDFASDPDANAASRKQMPPNWGGVCLPIRTTQQTLGVMSVSVPSGREFSKDDIRLLATLSEMTGAALQRMQLHEQTVRRLEQLHALRAVDQAIASNFDMSLTLNILLDHTVSQLGVGAAAVLLLHPGSNILELEVGRGFHSHLLESVSLSDSFAGRAIMEHRPIIALDFETANQLPKFGRFWKEEGFACYWCLPLIVKGEVKGVLEVYCRKVFSPDAEWIEFLEALAGQAAIAVENTQLFENLQRANMDLSLAYDATIEGWSRAMDLRDHETEGHTLRVTELTMKLVRAMHISESQLTAIRRGALLHDIGKIGVPDAILLKESALTDEEWVVMRKHPLLARDMLMPIAYLNDALVIPYCHHEKWDGTGYPQGLKGDHIPLAARIFAVVDVWDALTNDRTYRLKWTKQKARQYIKEQSGKHFDPQIVDVFLEHVEKSEL